MGEVVKDEYQTDYVAGQDNINPFGLDLPALESTPSENPLELISGAPA